MQKLIGLCRSVGTEPVLYMTWAKKDEPEKAPTISGIYRTLAKRYGTLLAPMAELFDAVQREHPMIDLYWHDGSHASPYGDYLIAATLAMLLTGTAAPAALPDRLLDFGVRFDREKGPHAIERAEKAEIAADAQVTAILRDYAAKAVLMR